MKTLKRMKISELKREFAALNEKHQRAALGGSGGYSWQEANAMMDNGTWGGGMVEGLGYMGAVVVIDGSTKSESNSGSNSSAPNSTFWNTYIASNAELAWVIVTDMGSMAHPAVGYVSTGINTAIDTYDYFTGSMTTKEYQTAMFKNILGFFTATGVFAAEKMSTVLGEFSSAWNRHFTNPSTYLNPSGFPF